LHSKQGDVYAKVIGDVCEASSKDFEEGGVELATLELLRSVSHFWHQPAHGFLSIASSKLACTNIKSESFGYMLSKRKMSTAGWPWKRAFIFAQAWSAGLEGRASNGCGRGGDRRVLEGSPSFESWSLFIRHRSCAHL
jgi:hypothetical protein